MRLGILPALRYVMTRAEQVPMGVRTRICDLFYSPEYSAPLPFEVDFFGLRYPGDLSSYLDWNVYFFGAYEKPLLLLLRDLFRRRQGRVFVDIGANVGQHSLFMARVAGTVHAFEPWARVRESFIEKLRRNRLDNVIVHDVGLSDRDDEMLFFAPAGSNTGTGSFDARHATDRNQAIGKLQVVRGDEYFKANNISDINLMKIDVEGWEKNVLSGLRGTLERERPAVVLEVSETSLKRFGSLAEFQRTVPTFYRASYIQFHGNDVSRSPFDFSRAGDVLMEPSSDSVDR
jgi:FkbM family methyltransferase